nr:SUMF1/EgtB/PvdO family nonheme iron enzyme [Spirochaetota bacterium]
VVQSMTAKGYRLLTCDEWEFAARYIGSTKPNHNYFVLKNGIYYTKGNGASGSSDYYGNTQILGEYAVNTLNSDHKTAIVKTKKPNALGIYDMSGNVDEWCFDKYNSASRTYRGGSWLAGGCILSIFYKMDGEYNETYEALGFRFCRKY